jgi:uncharacterized repeat protein (TIGR04138 family)
MHKHIGFEEALDQICQSDSRFHRDAYVFLREVLDLTVERLAGAKGRNGNHVTAHELLLGFRDHALKEFGPMVPSVLDSWGISRCGDVGEMVFQLIESGIFGKSDTDRLEDFDHGFDFDEAFVLPFRSGPSAGSSNVAQNC